LGGELTILDKPVSAYTEKERSRTIGVVLTDKTFAGGLSVYELVALGRQPHTGFFGRLTKEDRRIVEEAMEQVGIAHKARSYTAELSDGERQKVMIAKALVQECPLILLDEPTAFLDVVSRIEIMHLLHRLATEQNKAILLSTHDIEQALVLSDRLWLLTKGEGLQCGVTEDIILSHGMDSLFPHKHIRFDYAHGVYYPTFAGERQISVLCEDKTLLHWMTNALNRHGYRYMTNTQEGKPHIQANSAKEMMVNFQGRHLTCTSFEELLTVLKTLYI
jgi:iron complex transport system ATP-binding protein